MAHSVTKRRVPGLRLPARYYALLCDLLEREGLDVAGLLRAAGLRRAELHAPGATLSLAKLESLVQHATAMAGRADLGFEFGRQVKLTTHDILGYALLTCPTLDATFRLAARFHRLISPLIDLRYRRHETHLDLQYRLAAPVNAATTRLHLDAIVVAFHDVVENLMGRHARSFDVLVGGMAPQHRRYRELRLARLRFDPQATPDIRIRIDCASADRPLPMADANTLAMAVARCEALLRQVSGSTGTAQWVRMMLREADEAMPTLQELAHILHIGAHTLDRRLRDEGQRFRDISNEVRHERARELLRRKHMTVTQTALQLGYRDVANFTRAFRRFSGQTPTAFRTRTV